jgi:uracil-DNA glycosylase
VIAAATTIADLRAAAAKCTACPLYLAASQTVFGKGPPDARIMLIGEQPGDAEDLAGHPFVGPAGKLLDRCLAEAGIDRSRVWVTNIIKYFNGFRAASGASTANRGRSTSPPACRGWRAKFVPSHRWSWWLSERARCRRSSVKAFA